jgi:hypothetical protein
MADILALAPGRVLGKSASLLLPPTAARKRTAADGIPGYQCGAMVLLLLACGHDVPTPPVPDADPSAEWADVLHAVVSPDGLVDYGALRENRGPLDAFVGWIAEHGPESDRMRLLDDDKRLAWHLNAYNALVLYGVLEAGPIASVHDVPAPVGKPGAGFFWWWRFRVDRERVDLRWYERGVILATYEEPLAHAALNCASRSCPPLRDELYSARVLEGQLRSQMRTWVGRGAVEQDGDTFVFSPIFDWYADDFREWADAATPCAAVRPYVDETLGAALDAAPECPHRFAEWDWSLNAAPPR